MSKPYKYELAYELKAEKKRFNILLSQFRELGIEHEKLKSVIKNTLYDKKKKQFNFDLLPF